MHISSIENGGGEYVREPKKPGRKKNLEKTNVEEAKREKTTQTSTTHTRKKRKKA